MTVYLVFNGQKRVMNTLSHQIIRKKDTFKNDTKSTRLFNHAQIVASQ